MPNEYQTTKEPCQMQTKLEYQGKRKYYCQQTKQATIKL